MTHPLEPTPAERRARARADLRLGLPVVLRAPGGALALAAAVETLTPERFAALSGGAAVAITGWRARTLKIRAYDGDIARIALPTHATLDWVASVADPATDLGTPMKGPFPPLRGEDGPAPELARTGCALAKEARLLPAVLLQPLDGPAPVGLTLLDIARDVPASDGASFHDAIDARLPMALGGAGRLHVYRPDDGSEEHYAVEIGLPDRASPVLTRLHSACFTGDVLGSLKCDCGPQLHAALSAMREAGGGMLLYLNQEGRGIGLANKMRAYALQDQGFDTVEANHRLGFEDDERDFRIGSALLKRLGIARVRLMTNNPAKITRMEEQGIEVTERVPLIVGQTAENEGYLTTKARKSGHLL